MRARYPDAEGFVERDGVKIAYEVPLRHYFEQNFHVRHRLDRYGAGRCLDYDQTGPETLAHAIAAEIGRPVSYRPVETDGAARAAALIADLI